MTKNRPTEKELIVEPHSLAPEEIIYRQADSRYTDIYLTNGKHLMTTTNLGK